MPTAPAASQPTGVRSEPFRVGEWLVEPDLNLVSNGVAHIHLEPKTMQVLLCLGAHDGAVVRKEDLIAGVWADTFVTDQVLTNAIWQLREAFGKSSGLIQTVPRVGYRLTAQVVPVSAPAHPAPRPKWHLVLVGIAAAALLTVAAIAVWHWRRLPPLGEKDEILVADLANSTGEEIFDGTLKTAIAVKLQESPFLNIVSDARVRETLKLMEKQPDETVRGATALELCQRLNVKALLNTSIARLGSAYVITLEALNSQTGEVLAREQAEARGQGEVLNALGQATSKLRTKLGESVKSVQHFDTPLEQATTSSLEALKAFSLGWQQIHRGGNLEAARLFERAAELDPKFALAYQMLAACYSNIGEFERARAYTTKAFALRERASERERLRITADYYGGELDKLITTSQLYKQSYPRDFFPYHRVGIIYLWDVGSPDKALAENRKAFELLPGSVVMYVNLIWNLISMNRYEEAAAVLDDAVQKNISAGQFSLLRYELAFIREDRNAMAHWIEKTRGTAVEPRMVIQEAHAKAFAGQLGEARSLYGQTVKLARATGMKQFADITLQHQALVEAEFGNAAEAKAILMQSRTQSGLTALALARAGETVKAEAIADERAKRFPAATVVQKIELPLIRAAIALQHGRSADAVEAIQPTVPYELATPWCPWWFGCNPDVLYLISEAHLAQGDAAQATAAFQKLLDHRGMYATSPLYPLAYIGLARARMLAGDTVGARRAYDEFFAIWKHADPDIPILHQAKAEYAKLK